ncbi:MAG TPA: hypothetical protein VM182_11630 [Terriglobia bacterium]|nr:hypothetical protein [Terriglobia bacterium]
MKWRTGAILLVGTLLSISVSGRTLLAQACQDEETMVEDYRKGLTEMVEKVKAESLEEFTRAYHQKSCLSKLSLCSSIVNIANECLEKASRDPATSKDQGKDIEAKRQSYNAFKAKAEEYSKELKGADSPKDAKALIAKFDLPK